MPTVTIYSTTWCGACKRAKEYMRQRGIPFVDQDVENSSIAREEYNKYGVNGVPLIVVNGQQMLGFDSRRLEQMIGAN